MEWLLEKGCPMGKASFVLGKAAEIKILKRQILTTWKFEMAVGGSLQRLLNTAVYEI